MFKNLALDALGISAADNTVELALSHGFKGLNLDLAEIAEQVKSQGFAKATRRLTSARLKFGSFPLPVDWSQDNAEYRRQLTELNSLAELAVQLGSTRAVTTIEPGSDLRPFHQNFEYHRQRFAEIAAVLLPHKISMGLEFLAPVACRTSLRFVFIQSAEEAMLLARSVGAANVGMAIDSWHWHLGGGKASLLSGLAPDKIVSVTLAEADGNLTAENATLLARRLPAVGGVVDNAGMLAALAEIKYDGPVTPAADASSFSTQGREQIVKSAAAALDAVWKAAGLTPGGKPAPVGGR